MSNGNSALALPNGKVYLFHGTTYDAYAFDTGSQLYSGSDIASQWTGLRGDAPDAALHLGFGKAYFFYGDEYVRYELGSNGTEGAESDWPKKIAGNWPGVWADGVDAAVNWGNGKIYFFKGSEYVRYDIALDAVDPGYPTAITAWPGLWPDGVDGAVYQGGKYAYFFKGTDYARYDVFADTVDQTGAISSLGFDPVPTPMLKAARDLTPDEANTITGWMIENGKVTLSAGIPYTGTWQTGITSPKPSLHVVVQPPTINNIDFKYYPTSVVQKIIDNVDQRMLVALYRLTRWLKGGYDPSVDTILHKGIGHGNGPPNDCHNQGRALDFAGVRGTTAGAAFERLVLGVWGHSPPPPPGALQLDPAVVDTIAYGLFRTTHTFANYECESNGIGAGNQWPPKALGDPGGYVCHPDYVNNSAQDLRTAHQDHVHMQVGPTR
jgi:Hemopexin